jgi:hypothetical protein
LRERRSNETKVAEEYCWATTEAVGRFILRPITLYCVCVWILLRTHCVHILLYYCTYYSRFRLAKNPSSRGVSV